MALPLMVYGAGALIGAAATAYGAYKSSKSMKEASELAHEGQEETNKMNLEEAQRNREFQERMSSTAVQRRSDDLKQAGFNPLLATGASASQPSGSMATTKNPRSEQAAIMAQASLMQTQQIQNVVQNSISIANALGTYKQSTSAVNVGKSTIEKQTQETQNLKSTENLIKNQSKLTKAQRDKVIKELDLLSQQIRKTGSDADRSAVEAVKIQMVKGQYNPNSKNIFGKASAHILSRLAGISDAIGTGLFKK